MCEGPTGSDDLLKRLEGAVRISEPLRRRLWAVAVMAEALRPHGVRPILVGGSAIEFYTFGGYATADVDLVAGDRRLLARVLERFGFLREGRFWYREDLDLIVECPDEVLAGDLERVLEVEIEGLICPVIGIEDLIVDRLNGYVHWRWEDDRRWVRQLIDSHREDIDWPYLRERVRVEATHNALDEIVREIDEAD